MSKSKTPETSNIEHRTPNIEWQRLARAVGACLADRQVRPTGVRCKLFEDEDEDEDDNDSAD